MSAKSNIFAGVMSFFSPKSESNKLRLQMTLTFGGRVAALLCSFVNVVLTARFWGADGRGAVAVFMANVGVVMFACKVCTGGAAFHGRFEHIAVESMDRCARMLELLMTTERE